MTNAEKIRYVRYILRLTQPVFAKALGVSEQTIRNAELGKYKPSPKIMTRLDELINKKGVASKMEDAIEDAVKYHYRKHILPTNRCGLCGNRTFRDGRAYCDIVLEFVREFYTCDKYELPF